MGPPPVSGHALRRPAGCTLLTLVTVLPLFACSGPTVHTATYATLKEARGSGAVQTGKVPALLPENAYELRAAYATTGWQRWGIINFRAEDAQALREVLHPDEISLAGTVMDIPGRIEWWPVLLRGRLDTERIATTGLHAYRAKTDALVFAVNWNQGRAYYWTVR